MKGNKNNWKKDIETNGYFFFQKNIELLSTNQTIPRPQTEIQKQPAKVLSALNTSLLCSLSWIYNVQHDYLELSLFCPNFFCLTSRKLHILLQASSNVITQQPGAYRQTIVLSSEPSIILSRSTMIQLHTRISSHQKCICFFPETLDLPMLCY